jgi:hypothetical protein
MTNYRASVTKKSDFMDKHYLSEVSESLDPTKAMDSAFAKVNEWMMNFFIVTKIVMEKNHYESTDR